ncbi:MAG: phosphomannomutase/phosphoglucomutase [candidate division Zixibacteria bacterium]|nr:phosphomannomutase/phosphoglucomutase [candidate division Zixibacteria bacterium]MBU1470269.1 phosphomannomutase/phosphoglucomutase [candidate division Zixibacteria bacterium]MBU2626413.1 phosphomannomutase/phosphoglucomutase [candidate division Zixibacteria bacterium]
MTTISDSIFKAYDVRGIYGKDLNEDIAYRFGRGLARYLSCKDAVVGRDMRVSSPQLAAAMIKGIVDEGCDVTDIGHTSTDGLYFAVGKFGHDCGVMITASHNPPEYNGFKVCKSQAVPLSGDEGLRDIRDMIKGDLGAAAGGGRIVKRDYSEAYREHVLSFVKKEHVKPLKIVIDAGNGMAGKTLPPVFAKLPCDVTPLYFELDGTFPNHLASPIEPENIVDLQRKVKEVGADLGAAFDGDADRVFLVDEHAKPLGGDIVTAMVSKSLLEKEPGATILYNLICSKTVPETITRFGGTAIRTRVGHALIKPLMKEHNALFGGEHSGHFYFRNNWFADSGLIALLVCLELISVENKPLSAIVSDIDPYFRSGEVNSTVKDIPSRLKLLQERYSDGKCDTLDGITIDYGDWWFNVRPSNTEPLLRLNMEANSHDLLGRKLPEVLRLIREG